ncbi:MAG: GntR family transcriptional regulator [Alicyclobacillaceae bacterium]|nr:GntR family transcriptional regulator [Alicyclobacillaceae bacterium]
MYRTLSSHLTRTSLTEGATHRIRQMILHGELKPGERINEVHLSRDMQISRGPIREALLILESEGLVTHEVNKGATVTILSSKDAYEIYSLRAILESEAMRIGLPHIRDADYDYLQTVLNQFEQALVSGDVENMVVCDIDFHHGIVQISNHSRLIKAHQQLDPLVGAMFLTISNILPLRLNHVVEIHRVLLEALKSKDSDRVVRELQWHYMKTLEEINTHFSTDGQ